MKGLNFFNVFDFARFSVGKVYEVVGCSPWVEHNTGRLLGSIVEVVCVKDATDYGDKGKGLNRYEKLKFKCKRSVSLNVEAIVTPVNPVAKVWGDYNSQLSVTCDDVRVVESKVTK